MYLSCLTLKLRLILYGYLLGVFCTLMLNLLDCKRLLPLASF